MIAIYSKILNKTQGFLINLIGLTLALEGLLLTNKAVAQIQTVEQMPSLITVQSIEIVGNTIFPALELTGLLAHLLGKEVSLEELIEAQKKIENYYVNQGYRSSGSFLLQQKLQDGVVRIQVIEAILESIQIEGLENLSETYLKSRLPQEGKPLNYHHLLKALDRLQNDPLIQKLTGTINQSSLGKNVLWLEIEEESPWAARITATNGYSPSIGSFGGNASITHQNFFGFGDRLNLNRSQTEGLTRTGGSYSFPFNSLDGRIIFTYNNAESELTEDIVEDFGIKADYESFSLALQQPIISTHTDSLIFGLAIEHIDSETFVLEDFSFSFTDGLDDGKSKITALRFFQEYEQNGANTFLAARSQFNVGIDALDATQTKQGIDGLFWSWNGNFQWLKALNEEKDLIFATRILTQLTPDQLLPIEQFTIGGLSKVMGYRPNLGVADNGVIGTVELRIPLVKGENWGDIQIIPFFHLGNIWNNVRETTGSNTFASSGLAWRYRFKDAFEARIDYGLPIIKARDFGETDTEDNFSFSVLIRPLRF